MKKAVEAWLATKPLQNPDAPNCPFAMKEYTSAAEQEANRLNEYSNEQFAKAREATSWVVKYLSVITVFSSLILIGGVLPKFRSRGLRLSVLVFGVMLFMVMLARLSTFPIAH